MAQTKKFKLPVLAKNKNVNTAIYVGIAGLLIFLIYKAYQYFNEKRNSSNGGVDSSSGSSSGSGSTTSKQTYDNNTVFSWKTPLMKSDRVQWMQDAYNRISRLRAAHYLSSWPIIAEDSKFGENTEKAMVRMTGKKAVNWTEVKARAEALTAEITRPMPGYGGSW